MTQKQMLGVVGGVVLTVFVLVFVYQQYAGESTPVSSTPSQKKVTTETTRESVMVPVPETIDDIALSIESESAFDLSALDDEETGALDEVNQDSESVNNLGTSYDENNL